MKGLGFPFQEKTFSRWKVIRSNGPSVDEKVENGKDVLFMQLARNVSLFALTDTLMISGRNRNRETQILLPDNDIGVMMKKKRELTTTRSNYNLFTNSILLTSKSKPLVKFGY